MDSTIDTLKLDINNVTNLPTMTQFDFSGNGMSMPDFGSNTVFVFLIIFVLVVYLMFFLTSSSSSPLTAKSSVFETVLLVLFLILVTLSVLKYFFNIDVKASLVNIFSKEPELDIVINKIDDALFPGEGGDAGYGGYSDEVFHISDNIYTYEDAKGICGAFGGRLANYFDIEKAYQKGGEWCGYGWSDDQMVFFPTQRSTFDRLKKDGRQNDCGRPGVNGGFIDNPNARFGVNCVGKKPKITPQEQEIMDDLENANKSQSTKTNYWSQWIDSMNIASFNSSRWNM